jgi:diguanylate cyclase (GGDEF)-like protein
MAAVQRSPKSKPKPKPLDPLLQILPDGILLLDAKDRVKAINPAAAGMAGALEKAVLGKPVPKAFPSWPEWEKLSRASETPALAISPANPERTLEIRRWRIPPGRGKKTGGLILLRDVSDRVRMEQDHKRSMELLLAQTTEIQELHTSLRQQAIRDPLTHLYNRGYLIETLNRELARAARSEHAISLLRIRLDRFENADELHGEKSGIEILKIMSSLINRYIRRGDMACRYGDGEFVLIMPGAHPSVAGPRAEQLRKAFHDSILNFLGSKIECTFSCGVASFPKQGETADELLQSAEKAMQESAAAGGNRVTVLE